MIAAIWLLFAPAFAGPDADLRALSKVSSGYSEALAAAVANPALSDAALAQLAESPDWRLRLQAEVVLAWREAPEVAEQVATAEPRVARNGALQLHGPALAAPGAAPVLADRLLHETDGARRAACADALSRQTALDPAILSGLLLAEPDPAIRSALVWAWKVNPDAGAAQAGLRAALADPDPGVRAQAAAIAGYRADGVALGPDLVAALADPDPGVRALAARSLGWQRQAESFAALRPLLADPSAEVRLAALRAMERVDRAALAALPELGGLAQDPDPRVAKAAADLPR